ncbi:MAG TPA: tripartite tricarboxylate transporter substrate-binding protein [Xanthobacteraceae bacterium]|jgi:tripartite-type tricarboxylate transporter receptor subunit TctC|nr:tripartite tricarboxylate transporter substrate-binding protein [Xanthobacteraceae bacterium]
MQRFRASLMLMAGLIAIPLAASAEQNWSTAKPIKVEVISAAGGLTDIVPRLLSNSLSESTGVPVVIEDRPGAGGNIAAGIVAKADPDGHTLLMTGSNQAVNPTLLPDPGFDYERDLKPLSMAVVAKMLLVAAPSFPAKNIADVIRMAKERPKSVSIAISPIGTPNHLGAEMLAQYGGVDLTFVPYGGIAQAVPDVIAGRVDLAIGAVPSVLPQITAGKLKALATVSGQRSPLAPGVPTSGEAGLPNFLIDAWICFMVTGGTPDATVNYLDKHIAKALTLSDVKQAFARQGVEVLHMGPQELGTFLQSEASRFGTLLKNSKVAASR